ncbi:conserved hypothetical protein [Listeria monocytogenes]|nr:hypothetical protein AX10_13640 [Listeria monocytogenes WSLC1001]CUM30235.1 conserved hypothetical protein [Listeria monocytogenes]
MEALSKMCKMAQTKLYDVKLSRNLCTMINVIAFFKSDMGRIFA